MSRKLTNLLNSDLTMVLCVMLGAVAMLAGLAHQAGGGHIDWEWLKLGVPLAIGFAAVALICAFAQPDVDEVIVTIALAALGLGLFAPASDAYPGLYTDRLWLLIAASAFVYLALDQVVNFDDKKPAAVRVARSLAFLMLAILAAALIIYFGSTVSLVMLSLDALLGLFILRMVRRSSKQQYGQPARTH